MDKYDEAADRIDICFTECTAENGRNPAAETAAILREAFPAQVQPAPSEEEVEPPDALLRDAIGYAEGGKVLEPWMVRGLVSLRAQLAERTGEREALAQISQLERQIPYASAHGFVEYTLKKIGNLARAALDKKEHTK